MPVNSDAGGEIEGPSSLYVNYKVVYSMLGWHILCPLRHNFPYFDRKRLKYSAPL